jgi:hypothetical protein
MGKRELVLIALFVVVGIVVYNVTAPPPPPGSDVSVGGIFQKLRRGMQGARETETVQSRQTAHVDKSLAKLRVLLPRQNDLTIVGADGDEITLEARVTARGYTKEEAKGAAEAATWKIEPSGDAMVMSSTWNVMRRGGGEPFVSEVVLKMTVPRRLAVRLDPHIGVVSISDVAGAEIVSNRGETRVMKTSGAVQLNHTGGPLEIDGGTSLKVTSRNSRGTVAHIAGLASIDAIGSKLRLSDITGPLEIESRNSDFFLERSAVLKPPLRYNGTGGELRLEGLRTEARIDGRNTDIDVVLDAPAAVTIYNLGAIRVTAPPGGYTLDAAATEGRIESQDSSITATPEGGADARAQAKIRGGGPTLTLRSTRGRIEVRKSAGK